jgi:hypothetical protein
MGFLKDMNIFLKWQIEGMHQLQSLEQGDQKIFTR